MVEGIVCKDCREVLWDVDVVVFEEGLTTTTTTTRITFVMVNGATWTGVPTLLRSICD